MRKPITILHVEDDEMDVLSLQRSFRKAKVANEIICAANGEEALDILRGVDGREAITEPFVMLLDINMPRMNGIELLRELRSDPDLRHTVVFVLTTSDHDSDLLSAYDMNVAGYLLKQEAGEQFVQAVAMLDSYWRIVELPAA
jgi:CheY-like chemotaxis protein